jgi:hypothetical protein
LPEVPDIGFMRLERAAHKIRRAGFRVNIVERTDRFGTYESGHVLDQRPGAYSARMPGSIVTIVVAKAQRCTPGYSPCLPPAPDYDCEGGTGNGPLFTGFHFVSGSDPYGLDGCDNDGRGCE